TTVSVNAFDDNLTYTGGQNAGATSTWGDQGDDLLINAPGSTFSLEQVPIAGITWNNLGAGSPADGQTWDIGNNNNWNNGYSPSFDNDASNACCNDTNNGNYHVTRG